MAAVGILTRSDRKHLVSAYIKQITKNSPTDIIDLCSLFYDDVHEWYFNNEKLQSFLARKEHKQPLQGPSFVINEIEFQCKLYKTRYNQQIELDLYLVSIPSNIRSITYFLQLFCTQLKYEFRSFDIKQKVGRSKGWPTKTVSTTNLKQFIDLNLCCYLEILAIEYKTYYNTANYYKPIIMNARSEYKWEIDETLLNTFKTAENGRGFYADSFNNDCFCIILSPNGSGDSSKGCFVLGLKLLKMHHALTHITVQININTSMDNITWNGRETVSRHQNLVKLWPDHRTNIQTEDIQLLTDMYIRIELEIVALKQNNYVVQRGKFKEYGIIENNCMQS